MSERSAAFEALRAALAKVPGLGQAALGPETAEVLLRAAEEGGAADGQVVFHGTESVGHLYVVQAGTVRLESAGSGERIRWVGPGEAFGGHALAGRRGERATSEGASTLLRIPEAALLDALASDPDPGPSERAAGRAGGFLRDTGERTLLWLRSPAPYLGLLGYGLFWVTWYLTVEVLALRRFSRLPGITEVVHEWLSEDPTFGVSIYTPIYYEHIVSSLSGSAIAFALATALGVPVGLLLGWSTTFREYVFPVFEVLRPVPILAWVPLAIIMFSGSETPWSSSPSWPRSSRRR